MTFIQGTVISTQVLVQLLFAWLGKCRIYLNEIHLRRNLKHILHLRDFLRITFHISFGSSKSFLILVASFSKSFLILVAQMRLIVKNSPPKNLFSAWTKILLGWAFLRFKYFNWQLTVKVFEKKNSSKIQTFQYSLYFEGK